MAHLEQKSVLWMQNIVEKVSKLGELLVILFFGAFAIEKTCLKLPRHSHSVGCIFDGHCFAAGTKTPAGTYARKVLNQRPNISGIDVVVDASKIVI